MAGEPVRMCPTVEELPDGWQVKRLGSFCTKIGTGATPRGGSEVYLNSRISHALVRSQHVFDRHFDAAGLAFISDSHAKELRNAEIQSGDVLLNITGDGVTFGRSCIVPDHVLPACVNQHVSIIRPDRRECDPGYLLSVLTHPATKGYIESFNSGGSRRAITKVHIESFEIPLPPLAEQKAIAAVLGALDDKIELNRRMNATLEAMARALFQSWFVDFDPVRAKLDGRQPAGLDAATAAIFPATFQESSLGPIPHGWEVCPLSEKIRLLSGGTPKTSEPTYWNGDIPWYSVRDAPSETDVWVIHTDKHVTKLGIDNSTAQIFHEKTTIISARGTVGKLALTAVPMAMNQSCYGVRGIPGYGDYFTYYSLREASAQLQQRTHGTVFDTITTETFKTLDCIFPTPEITAAFEKVVEPLLVQIRANLLQSRTLATLRDSLLPKLLSGELRIADAERAAAEMA